MTVLPALPPPVELPAYRQRVLLERRVAVATGVSSWLSMCANPLVFVFAWLAWRFWWLPVASIAAFVAAIVAWWGSWWWARRRTAAALSAVRTALDLPAPSWRSSLPWIAAVGAALLLGNVPAMLGWTWAPTHLGLAMVFLFTGVLAPWLRRRVDPRLPGWVAGVIAAWGVVAAALIVSPVRWIGEDRALILGIGWMLCAPFGALGAWLREPVGRWMERDDALGAWSRRLSPLLPPAQRARGLRLAGDTAEALAALRGQIAGAGVQRATPDLFDELATTLAAVGDLRAIAVHAWAAHAFPDDPRPYVGLATSLGGQDPALALAYARHAEDCEARRLFGAPGPARAVRERFERG